MKKTAKTNDEIATAKLEARDWFLYHKEVPTITDMRKELGIDLANVLIGNFDSITRKLMSDNDDPSKPPMVKMTIPLKTTYRDICDRGDRIEQKIVNQMLNDSLIEQLLILKTEFCADLQHQEDELYFEYDQLKQDVLANMKTIFERDEFEFIEYQNAKRVKMAELIVKTFNKEKPHVLTAVAIRIQKLVNTENTRFLKQRCKEQEQVYMKLREVILTESHAQNKKFMVRILNQFGTSLSDQIQSIRSILVINNLYMALRERLKFQKQIENLKEKLNRKFQRIVEKCEKLLTQPVRANATCPNVELWKQKCLWLIDNYASFIESTTNKKEGYGRYFLDIERLMTNFESITQHDHSFYKCCYQSGGIIEYFDRAQKELILDLPTINQEVRPKLNKTSVQTSLSTNVLPIVVEGCYTAKKIAVDLEPVGRVDSTSSISSIEYNGHTYASLKSYNHVVNKLYPRSIVDDSKKIAAQSMFRWGDKDKEAMSDDEEYAVDEVVEIAANFRRELLLALDLNDLAKHIFNIIIESASKIALLKSTSDIEEPRDDHGITFVTPISSSKLNDRFDSLSFLLEVKAKLQKCIEAIVTPPAIIDFIHKFQQAKSLKRRKLFRARDSVMLTEKKLKQNNLYNMTPKLTDLNTQNIEITSDEIQEDDYNPPLYFHQNCLSFHYVFDSYLDKINSMIADDVKIPDDTKIELEESMRARVQLNVVDYIKGHLRNTRVLRKLTQKPKLLKHGILNAQNHFKTHEKIDEHASKMKLDKLLEIVDKLLKNRTAEKSNSRLFDRV